MYCKNCGNQLNVEDKFCKNCGASVQDTQPQVSNQQVSQPQNQANFNSSVSQTSTNKKKMNSLILVGIVIGLLIIIFVANGLGGSNNNNGNNNSNNNGNNNNDNSNSNSKIKGKYSREIFSGKSFDYKTMYDIAIFTFNSDSTFVVSYTEGETYKGSFEVYNGLFISIKADEVASDTNIQNAEQLANDIKNVSNAMMSSAADMLNTYLLWLKTDSNILQPFLIKYDPDTNTGTAVNIMGQTQGSFILK